jgi:signal transduction histidine kinase
MAARFAEGTWRMRFSGLSLRWRLSWLLVLGIVVTITLYGFVAYRAARAAAIDAAHARLRSAIVQINTITELGSLSQLEMLRAAAGQPAVIDAVKHPQAALSEAAAAALKPLQGNPANQVTVDLIVNGERGDAPPFPLTPEGAIGPLFEQDGVLSFQSGIAVPATGGAIRVTRRLGASSANRRIAANLLGPEAAFLVGNDTGTLWSDKGPIQYPGTPGTPARYVRDGITWLSAAAKVKGTPWLYAVEIPEDIALAPARQLIVPFALTGAIIAAGAAFAGLRLSRKITTPLAELTAATEAIARGDRKIELNVSERQDEIGRLARAFAKMSASVSAIQNSLEAEVDSRSGELSAAVEQLRRLDAELRQNQRFANIGRMSGSVSHELRNPLGVMNTVVALLDDLPDTSPRLKQYAQLLREQIRLSERIIHDLLERARSDARLCSTVDVAHFLDETIARTAMPATIRVERQYATPLPPVTIDRDQVGQIVWNLLTNAVQSMESQPDRSHTLTVAASVDSSRLRIAVSDTGPGIPADATEQVFEPMYTTKPDGTGLGLSISRSLARASGGELTLSQADGGGARFELELPLN